MRHSRTIAVFTVVAVALLAAFADLPGDTMLWGEVQNACHAPAFGVLAVAVLVLLQNLSFAGRFKASVLYSLAFGLALLAGVATEIIQHFAGRDAEFVDVIRDALGAAAFLALYYSLAFRRNSTQPYFADIRSVAFLSVALILLATAFYSLGYTAIAYMQRDNALPVLMDFNSSWGRRFCKLEYADLSIVSAPAEWKSPLHLKVTRLTLSVAEYPGLTIEEPFPDWATFDTLRFELVVPGSDTVTLGLRIDDSHHDYDFTDRFNHALNLQPGINSVRIALCDVELAPDGRQTDMGAIRRIILFAHHPQFPLELYLSRFWLE